MGRASVDTVTPDAHEPRAPMLATATAVEESDDYERSVRGVEIRSVRTGAGHQPTTIKSEVAADYAVTSVNSGFPMLNSTTIGDGLVAAAAIRAAPPTARWCNVDLEPGMVLLYGPGVEHTAVNPTGISFAFAIVAVNDLERVADSMHMELGIPRAGEVIALAPAPASARLHQSLAAHFDPVGQGSPTTVDGSPLLTSLTAALDNPGAASRIDEPSGQAGRRTARLCIEYAEAIGRVPTVHELCIAVSVSARTLHRAFTASFGIPPGVYFRKWGLAAARTRLVEMDTHVDGSVTTTAFGLGFNHLSRFAGYYRQQYGETPSETLNRPPRSSGVVV